ncbi:MAG: ABC transporter ATP-binding protein [Thermoanaerobacteraceae bacterium]|nr:ABC transporter ATP-binding protein [Thermoanaerobacteraceae bacterium]
MAKVVLRNFCKVFGNTVAVENLNITVEDGDYAVLVGPSGCGKTTTLRAIAGLEEVTEGEICIDNVIVNNLPPKDRDIAMVFQSYALYPHMTVYENMAFGLKLRKLPKKEINERVHEAAKILNIETLLNRKPKQLSGGQRQRVALGRAIVRKPKVFLFDEPLSNLDAKLRASVRAEISKLHKNLGATIIHVTHDQIEAMTMATKIFVMNNGKLQQSGSPLEVYLRPVNMFVAGFIGSPSMNFMRVMLRENYELYALDNKGFCFKLPKTFHEMLINYCNKELIFGIRPEDFYTQPTYNADSSLLIKIGVKVELIEPLGNESYVHFSIGSTPMIAKLQRAGGIHLGDELYLYIDLSKAHLFDAKTSLCIL